MKELTSQDYQSLTDDAQTIEFDLHGPKVLLLRDGSMLKLFRRKRLISSAMWYPYAQRFADNCQRLHELEVPCPEVLDVFRVREVTRDAVQYRPLEGITIRQLLSQENERPDDEALRASIGSFVGELHEKGVFFRSLHLGNMIRMQDGKLGLIDVADMRFLGRSLSRISRSRNLAHMKRYERDAAWLLESDGFANAYQKKTIRLIVDAIS